MKHSTKLLSILVIIFLLVGLGTLAAADTTQNNTNIKKNTDISKTGTLNKDTTKTPITETQDKNLEKQTINKKNMTKNTKTESISITDYNGLHEALTSDSEDVTINIQNDITLEGNLSLVNPIKLLTINGNHNTIDGNNQYHFLTMRREQTVIINDITITRCNSSYRGGAFYNNYGILTIKNSNLTYNTATESGGAIYNEGNLTVTNSNLSYNHAKLGGAITNTINCNANITDSNLYYNNVTESGGALYNYYGNLTVTNSNLTFNNANGTSGSGGAILNSGGNSSISNSNLINNNAKLKGGAICNDNNLSIVNSNLTNNNATNGGAIQNNLGSLIISNSNLIANTATENGGAIENLKKDTIIINSNITYNNANVRGGAIYSNGSLNISHSDIDNNIANDRGGAISNEGNMSITTSSINNNGATRFGGAIHNLGYDVNITVSRLINNSVTEYGGAVFNSNTGSFTIINSDIINSTSTNTGGAVHNEKGKLIIRDSILNNCTSAEGGLIYNANQGKINISNSNLTDSNATETGGAIINIGDLNITNSNIINNTAGNGGVLINYGNLLIANSNITDNTATSDNGTIENNGAYKISDTTFYNNTPANFVINNNHIQLVRDDNFITIGYFTLMVNNQIYQGNGLEQLEQYNIPEKASKVKLLLSGVNTTDNTFIFRKTDEITNIAEVKITNENPTCGSTTDIIATFIVDDNLLNDSKVIFRLNGKTMRDNDGKVIYVDIADGTAVLENVTITHTWTKTETKLQAIFTGNSEVDVLSSNVIRFTVDKREVSLDLIAPETAQAGDTITFNVEISSENNPVNTGRVVFKLNGKTLKDATGKALYVNVENGTVTANYTLPAKTKPNMYNLTVVFADNNYERCQNETDILITGKD